MSDRSDEGPRLSDTQLAEVPALATEADSVELKLTVPDAAAHHDQRPGH